MSHKSDCTNANLVNDGGEITRSANPPVIYGKDRPPLPSCPHANKNIIKYNPWNICHQAPQHKIIISTYAIASVKKSYLLIHTPPYKGSRVLYGHPFMQME